MIHAAVLSTGSVAGLAYTLSDLVPGAVEGLIKRVSVAAEPGAEEALFEVSDDAGAAFLRLDGDYGARAAAALAQGGDWVLAIEAGTRLSPDWHMAAGRHVRMRPGESAVLMGDKSGWLAARPVLYVLAPRRVYEQVGGFKPGDADLKALVKRLERLRKAFRL